MNIHCRCSCYAGKEVRAVGGSMNYLRFTDAFDNRFGRRVIYSDAYAITKQNVVAELGKALAEHWKNRDEIDYLDNYYRGIQPILFRKKDVRPEINNRVVENHAFEIVEHKVSEMFGEPVQYVLRGTDESKSQQIKILNDYMDFDDKGYCDIEIGRWRSICGTGYRFVWVDKEQDRKDETPFSFCSLDPRNAFVVYSSRLKKEPLFSVQQQKNEDGETEYFIYTRSETFVVKSGAVIDSGVNGLKEVPVIEYPNNERRISDIEIAITILDEINTVQSNRADGIEQFVQAFIKFVNCEIDEKTFLKMCKIGALSVKTVNSSMPADVGSVANELDQQQTQTYKDDLYDNMLVVEGMPDRQENSGGDTGQAVVLRNGFYFSEKRAELNEPMYKKSERRFLKIILRICELKRKISLLVSDIDIKITRSKMDNMQVKAQVLQMLLNCGIDWDRAIKTVNLWSDPEQVCIESRELLESKYSPDTLKGQETQQNSPVTI